MVLWNRLNPKGSGPNLCQRLLQHCLPWVVALSPSGSAAVNTLECWAWQGTALIAGVVPPLWALVVTIQIHHLSWFIHDFWVCVQFSWIQQIPPGGGSCGSSQQKIPDFVLSPLVSDRHFNLHCCIKNSDYLMASFKAPDSNKDSHKTLTRVISSLCAAGRWLVLTQVRGSEDLRRVNCFPWIRVWDWGMGATRSKRNMRACPWIFSSSCWNPPWALDDVSVGLSFVTIVKCAALPLGDVNLHFS